MGRRDRAPRRSVDPDAAYHSEDVARFINKVMQAGKKALAQRIVYTAFDIIRERTGADPLDIFDQAVENAMPALEVRSRRVGGATYQVPMEVRPVRRKTLAMRWLVQSARNRQDYTMTERLANELMDAANGSGGAVRRKEEMHRMAEANRAFAHYRW